VDFNLISNIGKSRKNSIGYNSYQLLRLPKFHVLLAVIQGGTLKITELLKYYDIFHSD
jgi:hypothetical protein